MNSNFNKLQLFFTVDGDWIDYTYEKLISKEKFAQYLTEEIAFARQFLQGKFIHLIHVSPLAQLFFLDERFIPYYHTIENNGGNIGIHSHMDRPLKEYNLFHKYQGLIKEAVTRLRASGLRPIAHRGGFFSYENNMTRFLEDIGIRLELSNFVNRAFSYGTIKVCDWSNSKNYAYRLDYNNYLEEGKSSVWEIPIGYGNDSHLYMENLSVDDVIPLLHSLKSNLAEHNYFNIAAVITHSYYFPSLLYSKEFKPIDNNLFRNKYLYKLFMIIQRINRIFPFINRILSLKKYSWTAIYYRRMFRQIIKSLILEAEFINGDEALSYLDTHHSLKN
ncbi:MAG: hypothetical protein AB1765_05945 [Candidatus Hydrogenedentota bacterium]